METVKDSTFLNVVESVQALVSARIKPRIRGSRSAAVGISEGQAEENLKEDIYKMVCNALSQQEKIEPVPELNADEIIALRALYKTVNNGKSTENDLEVAVHTVVKLLNPEFEPKVLELKQDDGGKAVVNAVIIRRSDRLAQIKRNIKYDEEAAASNKIFQSQDNEEGSDDDMSGV